MYKKRCNGSCYAVVHIISICSLEAFFSNRSEFWFDIKILFPIIACTVIIISLFFIICLFALTKVLYDRILFIYTLAFAFGIGFYLQGNYLPCDYGVLNGVEVIWENYNQYGKLSIIVWGGVVLGSLLWYTLDKGSLKKGITTISTCLILIETLTLGILYIQTNSLVSNETLSFTSKHEFEFSADENVILLCLDTFDSAIFTELIQENDKYKEWLPGFTYYPDTVGGYPTTKASIPFMVSGIGYKNQKTFNEYLEYAYKESNILQTLVKNDYEIDIYTSSVFASPHLETIARNISKTKFAVSSKSELGKTLYKYVMYKYMPHQLKKYFWMYTGEFDKYKIAKEGEDEIFSQDTLKFYTEMERSIKTDSTKKNYKFYHIEGMHSPYIYDENMELRDGVTEIDQARGNLLLIRQLVDILIDQGIYEKSSIIIFADHGQHSYHQNPLLLIKEKTANKDFKISSQALSYEMLEDIVISLINGDKLTNVILQSSSNSRKFLFYDWDNSWDKQYLPEMVEYELDGEAWKIENFSRTGVIYKAREIAKIPMYIYHGDDVIFFDESDKCRSLLKSGFGLLEKGTDGTSRMWSDGNYCIFNLGIEGPLKSDIGININANPLTDSIVKIYANNIFVDERTSNDLHNIIIPNSVVSKEGILEIKLDFGDVKSPYELGWNEERRRLGLYFSSIEFFEP